MFRFFNFWTFEEGYFETVAKAWKSTLKGNPMYVLMGKLKIVKAELKAWNKDRVGNVMDRVKLAKEELLRAQATLQEDPL
ncbi:hypothetical protein FRX31_018107, partial [Thalictrum thalictroides]